MRGGLDDALEKLARRDELRRRVAHQETGTPPAIAELVEAVAAVVARRPELGITIGVEGVGEPLLLHFVVEDGTVQVSADHTLASRPPETEPPASLPADFDLEPIDDYHVPSAFRPPPAYDEPPPAYDEPAPASGPPEQPSSAPASPGPASPGPASPGPASPGPASPGPVSPGPGQQPFQPAQQTSPAPPPPFVPSQQAPPPPQQPPRTPPVPLRVEEPAETEVAAKRLAALLREDPSLLSPRAAD